MSWLRKMLSCRICGASVHPAYAQTHLNWHGPQRTTLAAQWNYCPFEWNAASSSAPEGHRFYEGCGHVLETLPTKS